MINKLGIIGGGGGGGGAFKASVRDKDLVWSNAGGGGVVITLPDNTTITRGGNRGAYTPTVHGDHTIEPNAVSLRVPWTPRFIDTAVWLDASDASTIIETNGRVSQWNDKSGNDKHVTQTNANRRPVTGQNTINDLNTLTFTADWLTNTSMNITGNLMVFIVGRYRQASTTTWGRFLSLMSSDAALDYNNAQSFIPLLRIDGTAQFGAHRAGASAIGINTIADGGVFLSASGYNGTAMFSGFNGAASPATVTQSGGISAERLYVNSNTGVETINGDYGEVIIVNEYDLTTRQRMEGYLAHKWGLEGNLPNDHPHKNSAP